MTKVDAIRASLKAAGKPLTLYQLWPKVERRLRQVVGKHKLYVLLGIMKNDGEVVTGGGRGDDKRTYALAKNGGRNCDITQRRR
mgnify:CR=1 FL=1